MREVSRRWKVFEVLSVGLLLGLSFVLLAIFFIAYLTGQPVMVEIDRFSEHHVEAILLLVCFGVGLVTLVRMVIRMVRR